MASLTPIINYFFVWDQICAFGAGMLWVLLHFCDLKKVGKLQAGWMKIIGVLVMGAVWVGPGAAMAGMWWWREEILARRKVVVIGNWGWEGYRDRKFRG